MTANRLRQLALSGMLLLLVTAACGGTVAVEPVAHSPVVVEALSVGGGGAVVVVVTDTPLATIEGGYGPAAEAYLAGVTAEAAMAALADANEAAAEANANATNAAGAITATAIALQNIIAVGEMTARADKATSEARVQITEIASTQAAAATGDMLSAQATADANDGARMETQIAATQAAFNLQRDIQASQRWDGLWLLATVSALGLMGLGAWRWLDAKSQRQMVILTERGVGLITREANGETKLDWRPHNDVPTLADYEAADRSLPAPDSLRTIAVTTNGHTRHMFTQSAHDVKLKDRHKMVADFLRIALQYQNARPEYPKNKVPSAEQLRTAGVWKSSAQFTRVRQILGPLLMTNNQGTFVVGYTLCELYADVCRQDVELQSPPEPVEPVEHNGRELGGQVIEAESAPPRTGDWA